VGKGSASLDKSHHLRRATEILKIVFTLSRFFVFFNWGRLARSKSVRGI
jgi:hypothetical protein